MITVTLNRTEFEYDIHSLIKAFFPKEDVELYYTKEAHADEKNVACTNHSAEQEEAGSSHFSIDYADDRISIAWDDAPDGPARRTFAVDFSNRTETKNALKEHLYRLLEEETGQPLPWGTLTGIRPTKIPMQMLDEGKTKEEIAGFLKEMELDDVAGKPVSEYSGGMKRRVAIARALLAEYDILIMDEPLQGLDAETKEKVATVIKTQTAGKTVLFVTHDEKEAEFFEAERMELV